MWKSTFIFTECEKLTAFPWKVSPKPSLFDCSPFCQINPRPWLFSFFRLLQRMLQDCFLKTKETEKYWMLIPRCVYLFIYFFTTMLIILCVKLWKWDEQVLYFPSFSWYCWFVFVDVVLPFFSFVLWGWGTTSWVLKAIHMIGICLSRQSAPEKYNQEKNPTLPLLTSWISQNVSAMFGSHKRLFFRLWNKQTFRMFSLRDLPVHLISSYYARKGL